MDTAVKSKPALDETKLHEFLGKMLGDVGAAVTGALVVAGDRLGFYRTLAEHGPMTSHELAKQTGTHERYVREWLANQAASGYLTYDSSTRAFTLPPENAAVLADETSPFFLAGAFHIVQVLYVDEPRITEAFKTGNGFGWSEHDQRLFPATNRFFRPGYVANIVQSWIPALDGVDEKLRKGAKVADVGCGYGTSTMLMAQAYPNSQFTGFDYHQTSIEAASESAKRAGLEDRVSFQVAPASSFPGSNYDFIACFDCIHDMGDPVGVVTAIHKALAKDGTLMIVEPFANDTLEGNINPVGRIYYGASTMLCTPASLAQEGKLGLGAQAGEARMRAVFDEAGYSTFRRATETPFNIVYEALP